MRIAYFNCFAGIAGDMTVGALLDAGLDFDLLKAQLDKLGIPGYRISRQKATRHHIAGTKFDVLLEHEVAYHTHEKPGHGHADGEGHAHPHEQARGEEAPHVHRTLGGIVEIITRSELSSWVKQTAVRAFTRLGEAEARVHDMPLDEVHFHEVGAIDAVVDIVGACVGIESLGIERVYSSPVRVGTGTINVAHGSMPVPAPGTLELLRGVPVQHSDVLSELATPTGVAIITTLAQSFGAPPVFVPEHVGYGVGGRDLKEVANLLRVEIGQLAPRAGEDEVVVLETNIDDMTPEVYGFLMERLFEAGAKDVFLVPVIMKKNRPGILLSVVGDQAKKDRLIDVLFRETSTLGVRISSLLRRTLTRESGTVDTPWGKLRVKRAEWNGEVRVTPEYEDCAAVARKFKVPILQVYEAVRRASPS